MTVVVGAILCRDGRILLGHRNPARAEFPDVWDVIGGHVEPPEAPADALRRELSEELGIRATVGREWRRVVDEALDVEVVLWRVFEWVGEIANRAPDEHDELRWFGPHEVAGLAFPHPTYPELLAASFTCGEGERRP